MTPQYQVYQNGEFLGNSLAFYQDIQTGVGMVLFVKDDGTVQQIATATVKLKINV